MKLRTILKNLRLVVLAAILSMTPASVFASDEFSADYPSRINYIPAFYISRIDLTNNELEFTLNTLEMKTIARFGAAWISDRSEEYLNADIRNFPSVDETWSKKVFWSDDYDLDIESYHSGDSTFLKRYTVDAVADLKDDIYWDMYYIAETTDGQRWINKVTYEKCGVAWVAGKACIGNVFKNDVEVDNVQYFLRDAPAKFTKIEIPRAVVAPDPDPTFEPEPIFEPEPTLDLEPELEPASELDSDLEPGSIAQTDAGEIEFTEPILATEVVALVEQGVTDINNIEEENIIEELEDFNEVYEGFGDSTLDVPILGGKKEIENEEQGREEVNVWMYFIFGVAIGAILTWFLSFIVKKINTSRKLKYKE